MDQGSRLVGGVIDRVNKQSDVVFALEDELPILQSIELDPVLNKDHAFSHFELQPLFADYVLAKIADVSPDSFLISQQSYDSCFLEDIIDLELRALDREVPELLNFQFTKQMALKKVYQQMFTQLGDRCHGILYFISQSLKNQGKYSQKLLTSDNFLNSVTRIVDLYQNLQFRIEDNLGELYNPSIVLKSKARIKKQGTIESIVYETALMGYVSFLSTASEKNIQFQNKKHFYKIIAQYNSIIDTVLVINEMDIINLDQKQIVQEHLFDVIPSFLTMQLQYFSKMCENYKNSYFDKAAENQKIIPIQKINIARQSILSFIDKYNKHLNYLMDSEKITRQCDQIMQDSGIYYH